MTAKQQAIEAMRNRARNRHNPTMSYSDLCAEITAEKLHPHNDGRLYAMLGEITREEYHAGRGMLTAVVINRETNLPGDGFFEEARNLGLTVIEKDQFWLEQLSLVCARNR